MSVMKALDQAEVVYTRDGKKRVTHEAYSYHITPYQNPPVKLEMVKGFIDKNGHFLAIPATAKTVDITLAEFRELISPTPQGKPAGDFRLSDVLGLVRRRSMAPAVSAANELAAAAAAGSPEASGEAPPDAAGEPAAEAQPAEAKEPAAA